MPDLTIQPKSEFDVDFNLARQFYQDLPIENWQQLESIARAAKADVLAKGGGKIETGVNSTGFDTHGLVAVGAEVALMEGAPWEGLEKSILIACHYGLAYAEVSLALNRSHVLNEMRPWKGRQDFQTRMKTMGFAWSERTAARLAYKKQQGLPLPLAATIIKVMKSYKSRLPKHLFAAAPYLMGEIDAIALGKQGITNANGRGGKRKPETSSSPG
jgi:hypothetical protein